MGLSVLLLFVAGRGSDNEIQGFRTTPVSSACGDVGMQVLSPQVLEIVSPDEIVCFSTAGVGMGRDSESTAESA